MLHITFIAENMTITPNIISMGVCHSGCFFVMMLSMKTCENNGLANSTNITTNNTETVHIIRDLAGESNRNIGFFIQVTLYYRKDKYFCQSKQPRATKLIGMVLKLLNLESTLNHSMIIGIDAKRDFITS